MYSYSFGLEYVIVTNLELLFVGSVIVLLVSCSCLFFFLVSFLWNSLDIDIHGHTNPDLLV